MARLADGEAGVVVPDVEVPVAEAVEVVGTADELFDGERRRWLGRML